MNQKSTKKLTKRANAGFSLIEMIVATSIFIVTILIVVGALLSLQTASRKARSVRVVTDNLSAAIDSMSRNLRMATYVHCGETGALDVTQNCQMTSDRGEGGASFIAFEQQQGDPHDATDQYVYRLTGGRIERSVDSGATYLFMTAPEINVTKMRFYVTGSETNSNQPYVTMVLSGTAAINSKTATTFNIQTTVSVRTPNYTTYNP